MSFLFSLKGKVGKQRHKAEATKRKAFEAVEKESEKKAIDSFDAKAGAMQGLNALSHKPELIIKPIHQTSKLRRAAKLNSRDETDILNLDAATRSLISGETLETTSSKLISVDQPSKNSDGALGAENTSKDYEDVPVEEFGAALLRGMGWKGPDKESAPLHTRHRQRGAILGIGAKPIDKELELDLLNRKALSVPMIKKQD